MSEVLEPAAIVARDAAPNDSALDFQAKYAGKTHTELAGIAYQLNMELIEELGRIAEHKFQSMEYQSEVHAMDERPGAISSIPSSVGTAPAGMGRVWPVTRGEYLGGAMDAQTAYITETEYPAVFAKLDEKQWTARKSRELAKAQSGKGQSGDK